MKMIKRLLCISLLLPVQLFGANEKDVPSSVTQVTIFRQGAQITRPGKGSFPAGTSILKFGGISTNLDKNSIQFNATGDFTISTNDEIEVKKEGAAGARYDHKTGKLSWELNLQPQQSEKLNFSYSVKYPKRNRLVLE